MKEEEFNVVVETLGNASPESVAKAIEFVVARNPMLGPVVTHAASATLLNVASEHYGKWKEAACCLQLNLTSHPPEKAPAFRARSLVALLDSGLLSGAPIEKELKEELIQILDKDPSILEWIESMRSP